MDNPRKVLAIFFCFLLLIMYKQLIWDPFLHGSKQPQVAEGGSGNESNPGISSAAAPAVISAGAASSAVAPISPAQGMATGPDTPLSTAPLSAYPTDKELKESGLFVVRTSTGEFTLSFLGGRLNKLDLTEYKESFAADSPPLNLIQHVERSPLPLGVYTGEINDARVLYVTSLPGVSLESPLVLHSGEEKEVVLEGVLPDGRTITKSIKFYGSGYLADIGIKLSAPADPPARLELEWTERLSADSASLLDPYNISGFVWFDGQKANRESFSNMKPDAEGKDPRMEVGNIQWVALTDKYFMTSLLLPQGTAPGRVQKEGQIFLGRLSGEADSGTFRLFFGPKKYRMLKELGYELHRSIDFGWTGFVAAPLLMLLHLFFDIFGNYGIAIVTLTILVKFAIYPLTSASIKQMKAMQEIQPEVKRIRETIADKQQQQIELLALYKKRGVNPMGGCFPMLLQMPVFIGLYSALLLAIELRHAPFAFWIKDLSAPEHLTVFGVGIPVLVVIMTISMIVQQYTTPTQMDPVQKKVMLFMPIMFGFMFMNFPAGLTIYMLTNNLISIAQQQTLQRKGAKSAFYAAGATAAGVFLLTFVLAKVGA